MTRCSALAWGARRGKTHDDGEPAGRQPALPDQRGARLGPHRPVRRQEHVDELALARGACLVEQPQVLQPLREHRGRRPAALDGVGAQRLLPVQHGQDADQHAVGAQRHADPALRAERGVGGQAQGAFGLVQPLRRDPLDHLGGRLAQEDRPLADGVHLPAVRAVRDERVVLVLDDDRAVEVLREVVDDLLDLLEHLAARGR